LGRQWGAWGARGAGLLMEYDGGGVSKAMEKPQELFKFVRILILFLSESSYI